MGCGSSNSTAAVAPEPTEESAATGKTVPNTVVYPKAEAFEVPLDDEVADESAGTSIIKKHPPKRLQQRLTEPTVNKTPPTIEDLEEKLANAELRRNQFLQQRIDRNRDADDTESSSGTGSGIAPTVDERNERNKRDSLHSMPQIADESEPASMLEITQIGDEMPAAAQPLADEPAEQVVA